MDSHDRLCHLFPFSRNFSQTFIILLLLIIQMLSVHFKLFIFLYFIFQLFQATYGAALRTKGSRSSLRSGPERENGGVGSSPDFPKSMSTVPIARSSAVSLVWSLTYTQGGGGHVCVPARPPKPSSYPATRYYVIRTIPSWLYIYTVAMSYLFTDLSPPPLFLLSLRHAVPVYYTPLASCDLGSK